MRGAAATRCCADFLSLTSNCFGAGCTSLLLPRTSSAAAARSFAGRSKETDGASLLPWQVSFGTGWVSVPLRTHHCRSRPPHPKAVAPAICCLPGSGCGSVDGGCSEVSDGAERDTRSSTETLWVCEEDKN